MTRPRVSVVGSFMMDLIVRAPRRPNAGETLAGSDFGMFLGGKGFNQAVAAARSGAEVWMIGRLGADEFGERFLTAMLEEGIHAEDVTTDLEAGTGVGLPLVEPSGENSIVIVPRANQRVDESDIERASSAIRQSRVLLLQMELPVTSAIAAARIAKEARVAVVFNPAPALDGVDQLRGLVDYLVPNELEAQGLSGVDSEGDGALEAALRLMQDWKLRGVLLTLGARGALVVEPDGHHWLPPHQVTAVDTVGAGDAVCGALATRLADDDSFLEAAKYGNAAGALTVTKIGAEPALPTRGQIMALLIAAV